MSSSDDVFSDLRPGQRLKISASDDPDYVYSIESIAENGKFLNLTTLFIGESHPTSLVLTRISGGVPQIVSEHLKEGTDEYMYDIYFTGGYWGDLGPPEVNVFGDGTCEATSVHIRDGMNRNIVARTLADGGMPSSRIVLDKAYHGDELGTISAYNVPPIFSVFQYHEKVERIVVKDTDSSNTWETQQPSFKLKHENESTPCIPFDSLGTKIQEYLNELISLCHGLDECVTVTKTLDAIVAPNGFVYSLFFAGDINPIALELSDSEIDCTPFSVEGGESVILESIAYNEFSGAYSSSFVSLGSPQSSTTRGKWFGSDSSDLSLYRVTGKKWLIEFENYLGNAPAFNGVKNTLPEISYISIHDDLIGGENPLQSSLQDLNTGVPYFIRMKSRNDNGISDESNIITAIPSGRPGILQDVVVDHVTHIDEIQSISIGASRIKEVQSITTKAVPIPEVQEISLISEVGNLVNVGYFSVRNPEIQVISWYSSSIVTQGSFYLTLELPDLATSIVEGNGTIKTKLLRTPCIAFDATAAELKAAIEDGALENGLPSGSLEVQRSSKPNNQNFGYAYTVRFIGDSVRGNINQFSSDWTLSGKDANGGNSCIPFDATVEDEVLSVVTLDSDPAIGTDTPHVVLMLNADNEMIEGEFELTINYLGEPRTTSCIPWNADDSFLQLTLENLTNIDSVFVRRTGTGRLGNSADFLENISFDCKDGADFFSYNNEGVLNIVVGDRIQFTTQQDMTLFYTISAIDTNSKLISLSQSYHGRDQHCRASKFFSYRYDIYFDGQAMHGSAQSSGFDPTSISTLSITSINNCKSFKTKVNGSVKEFAELPDINVDIFISSRYGGGYSLPATSSDDSVNLLQENLSRSFEPFFFAPSITKSLEDKDLGVTYTVRFDERDGDVSQLVCNTDETLRLLSVSCVTSTVTDGNELSGVFYLNSSDAIPFNALPSDVEKALESLSNLGDISVSRSDADGQAGYTWLVTFESFHGNVDGLVAVNGLLGMGASVIVTEVSQGNEIGGYFRLSYGNDTTNYISHEAHSIEVQSALRSFRGFDFVEVTQNSDITPEGGKTFLVTFIGSNLGDVELLMADYFNMTGVGITITTKEEQKGSLASGNAIRLSFDFPHGCSQSQVKKGSCGSPILDVKFDVNTEGSFTGVSRTISYSPANDVQIVSISSPSFGSIEKFTPSISGYFQLTHADHTTAPIGATSDPEEIRLALEALPSIETVKVSRDLSRTIFVDYCIDVTSGSSLVTCSQDCSCDFAGQGLRPNELVNIGSNWYRVASFYNMSSSKFNLAWIDNSLITMGYIGQTISNQSMHRWAGGFEWRITFQKVSDRVGFLSSPSHHLFPSDSIVEISYPKCKKCFYIGGLTMWRSYFIRAAITNRNGIGPYTSLLTSTPKGTFNFIQ